MNYAKMSLYDILEVVPTVSSKDLKQSYLKLAKKYHPDVYKGTMKDHFKKVNEAYMTLKNPLKRKEYDIKFKHT